MYKATATRGTGTWWEIEITHGLPANTAGYSQCRRLTEVEPTAKTVIADLTGADVNSIDVEIHVNLPEALHAKVDAMRKAAEDERNAQELAARRRTEAATALMDADMTMREAGHVLGVSHQRIKQLVDQAV